MQKIYFGAPGTGKSHTIDKMLENVPEDCIFRVTFYPDFSYSDFVGQLLPVVRHDENTDEDIITYEFVKGIFTTALEKAYENRSRDVYLIIEEMSRGDCAAIFGDIFQLLDRRKDGVERGYSRYFINNEMIAKDIIALPGSRVKLPPKLHIFGTVNTSDQNVFTMDTAFKRRFEWEYISPDPVRENNEIINNPLLVIHTSNQDRQIEWASFYQKLNEFISDDRYLGLGEDKQIGPFFIEFDLDNPDEQKNQIKNKLLHYLWEDVHKASYKSDVKLFESSIGTYYSLYKKYEDDQQVFSNDFLNIL